MKKTFFTIIIVGIFATGAYAAMGFLKGEQVSGMNKICFYDVLGSTMTLNIKSYGICPVTHNF